MSTTEVKKSVDYDIDELFKKADEIDTTNRLTCVFWGPPGVGKSYAAMTFPGPMVIIDTDGGIRLNLKYFKDKKDIRIMDCNVPFANQPKDNRGNILDDPFSVDPLASLEKLEFAIHNVANFKPKTIIIDTITDVWSWIGTWLKYKSEVRTTKIGTDTINRFLWGDANNRYDWMVKMLKGLNCNVILIARSKDVYSGGESTNQQTMDAQKKTASHVDIVAEFKQEFSTVNSKVTRKRVAKITKSRGANITNPIIEDLDYDKLITLLDESH